MCSLTRLDARTQVSLTCAGADSSQYKDIKLRLNALSTSASLKSLTSKKSTIEFAVSYAFWLLTNGRWSTQQPACQVHHFESYLQQASESLITKGKLQGALERIVAAGNSWRQIEYRSREGKEWREMSSHNFRTAYVKSLIGEGATQDSV